MEAKLEEVWSSALSQIKLILKRLQMLTEILAAYEAGNADVIDRFNKHKISKELTRKIASTTIAATLVEVISYFEHAVANVCAVIIQEYPQKAGDIKLDFKDIIECSSIEAVTKLAAEKYIAEIMYSKPIEYKRKIAKILSIDFDDLETPWNVFIEAKSRRDLAVHNNWIVNAVYLAKIKEIGIKSEHKNGESLFPSGGYVTEVINSIIDILVGIFTKLEMKHGS